MKRLLLIITVSVFLASNVSAQSAAEVILLNHKTLSKKAAASDKQIKDEKKNIKSATWVKRGKIYQDIFTQGLEQVQLGMGTTGMKVFYGDPLGEPEIDSNNVEIYKYETINYYFEDGKMRAWTRNNAINENPLDVSLKSYQKGIELTEAEKQIKAQEKIKGNLNDLKIQFQNSGQSNYFLGNHEAALKDFESILEINKFPVFEGVVDTMMINFSGIVAREIGRLNNDESKYREAINYYKMLTELDYGGTNMYIQMTRDYYSIGDTLGAIDNLKRGLKQYPDSTVLVTLTAQAYYLMKNNEGGIAFTDARMAEKPDCAEAYYWKGLLITNHDNLSQDTIDLALELYKKAVEVDPTKATIWYQAGYVYYALGANYFELEGYEADADRRKVLIEKGDNNYENAVINLEKTYEIAGDELNLKSESLELLKRIYYKLYGNEDERYLSTMERIKNL